MDANFKSNLSRLSDANAKLGSERTNSLKNKKITLQGNVLRKKSIKIKLASRDPSKESADVTPADVQRLAIKDVVLNSHMLGGNGSLLGNSSSQKNMSGCVGRCVRWGVPLLLDQIGEAGCVCVWHLVLEVINVVVAWFVVGR